MRTGGNSCFSLIPIRNRPSTDTQNTISQPMAKCTGPISNKLSIYPENYHREIDEKLHAPYPATEMITEINVPRPALKGFLEEVREDFRKHGTELIYGTVRLIERDEESFLRWAKQPYACTVFNLHVIHSPEGLKRSAYAF